MGIANLPASVALERRFQLRMLICLLSLGLLGGLAQRYERALFLPGNPANQPSAFTAIVPPPAIASLAIAPQRNAAARGRLPGAGGSRQPGDSPSSPIFDVPSVIAPTADAVAPPTTDSVDGAQQPTDQRRNFFTGGDNPLGGAGGVEVAALPDPGAGGVPEPASWGLMILGVGLVGGTLRRRRARQSDRDLRGAAAMVSDIA